MPGTCLHDSCRRGIPGPGLLCRDHARVNQPGPLPGFPPGLSYRQIDYWCRAGYLRPDKPTPGSGRARAFTLTERVVARVLAGMLDAGLELATAARVARTYVETGSPTITLRGGTRLTVNDVIDLRALEAEILAELAAVDAALLAATEATLAEPAPAAY